jgi:hypothetical protein
MFILWHAKSVQTNFEINQLNRILLKQIQCLAEFYNIFRIVSEYFQKSKMSTIADNEYFQKLKRLEIRIASRCIITLQPYYIRVIIFYKG